MTTATPPAIRVRNAKYQANVTKRGQVKSSTQAEKKAAKKSVVNPYLVAFLLVVLCGGAFF
ncbi:hypothetical protein BCR41DRAFT_365387, partial [Lobosporangium transversale]